MPFTQTPFQQANIEPDRLPVGPDGSDVLIPAAGARQEVTRFHSAVLSHDGGRGGEDERCETGLN